MRSGRLGHKGDQRNPQTPWATGLHLLPAIDAFRRCDLDLQTDASDPKRYQVLELLKTTLTYDHLRGALPQKIQLLIGVVPTKNNRERTPYGWPSYNFTAISSSTTNAPPKRRSL